MRVSIAAALSLVLVSPTVAAAAPSMRVTRARLDVAARGSLAVQGTIDDSVAQSLEFALMANMLTATVTDGAAFKVNSASLLGCTRVGAGFRCSANSRRFVLKRTATPSVYRFRLSLGQLPRNTTGTTQPVGPVRVSINSPSDAAHVDVIGDCEQIGAQRLGCRERDRPNIIFIVSDDQRWDTLQYMPQTLATIAARGITFTNAFVTTPLCSPSRSSMLSGLYARHHGVLTNAGGDSAGARAFVGADASTLATWLHDAGYRTGMIGKYMTGYAAQCPPLRTPCYIPPGWDDWQVFLGQAYYNYQLNENGVITSYGNAESDYSTDVLSAKAVEFIEGAEGQPFFLHIGYQAPHGEGAGVPVPARRHVGTYRGVPPFTPPTLPPWRPLSYDEDDVGDKPPWMAVLPRADDFIGATSRTWGGFGETDRLLQLETLLALDEGIAAIMAAVEHAGQAENTVILFTSDNGFFWGEHRLFAGKDYPYIESLRVPLLIRYPRKIATARSDDHLIANIDFPATLAALAGVTPTSTIDGRSAADLLVHPDAPWNDEFLFEWFRLGNEALQSYVGLATPTRHLITYPDADAGTELYDLDVDPYQLDNVAADPAYDEELATLQGRLDTLRAE